MLEEWRPVIGYEGLYEVSSMGRVRSITRTNSYGRTVQGQLITNQLHNGTHYKVGLSRNGKQKGYYVHALMLEAFVSVRPEGLLTRHLNGDGTDNRLDNLAWGTPEENQRDAVKHGVNYQSNKTHCPLGHKYLGNNLIQWWLDRGERRCWSCVNGRKYARRNGLKFTKEVADRYYSKTGVA